MDACIKHEEHVHTFYKRHAESLPDGEIKKLFHMLAHDENEHIKLIEHIKDEVLRNNAHPDIKMASDVQSFQNTSLYKLMRRLDRNTHMNVGTNEMEAMVLAAREHGDTSQFYGKMVKRFQDPSIQLLFKTLSNFQDENRLLIESYLSYIMQGSINARNNFYWEDEEIHKELHHSIPGLVSPRKDEILARIKKGKSRMRRSS